MGLEVKVAGVDAGWKDSPSIYESVRKARKKHPEIDGRVQFLLNHRSEVKLFDFDAYCSDEVVARGVRDIAEKGQRGDTPQEWSVGLQAWKLMADMKGMVTRKSHVKTQKVSAYEEATDDELLSAAAEVIEMMPLDKQKEFARMLGKATASEKTITIEPTGKLDS